MTEHELQLLREPVDWRQLEHETPEVTQQKIARAKELGVIAVLFTAEQVSQRIKELARVEYHLRNGSIDQTVYASILRGSAPFTAALFKAIAALSPTINPTVDYIQASRYGDSQTGQHKIDVIRTLEPRIGMRRGTDIAGMRFTPIDDTIDEGLTVDLLGEMAMNPELCEQLGSGVTGPASELGLIALTDKRIALLRNYRDAHIQRGFWIPNAWAGGMGLDGANEALRWAPELVLTAAQSEKYYEDMPEILYILGERAIMGMNDIHWLPEAA